MLLVSQPTRGVDLCATQFIWRTITEARDAGAAVLLSSADLSELLALSRPAGRLLPRPHRRRLRQPPRTLTTETLGTYMLGLADADARGDEGGARMSSIPAPRSAGDRAGRRSAARRRARCGAAAIALGVAFIIVLLTSKAPLRGVRCTLLTAPISRARTIGLWIDDVGQADHHRARLQPGVPGAAVRHGRAGAGLYRRAGRELRRAVAGRRRPGSAIPLGMLARDGGGRLLRLPPRHRQGEARRQRDRLVADAQLHRDRAQQLPRPHRPGAARQRRADHRRLPRRSRCSRRWSPTTSASTSA